MSKEIDDLIKEKIEKELYRRDFTERFISIERQNNPKFKIEDAERIIQEIKTKMSYMKDYNVCSENIKQFYVDFMSRVIYFFFIFIF